MVAKMHMGRHWRSGLSEYCPAYIKSTALTLRFLPTGSPSPMRQSTLTTCGPPSASSNSMLVGLKGRLVVNRQHTRSMASGEGFPRHGHGRPVTPSLTRSRNRSRMYVPFFFFLLFNLMTCQDADFGSSFMGHSKKNTIFQPRNGRSTS